MFDWLAKVKLNLNALTTGGSVTTIWLESEKLSDLILTPMRQVMMSNFTISILKQEFYYTTLLLIFIKSSKVLFLLLQVRFIRVKLNSPNRVVSNFYAN